MVLGSPERMKTYHSEWIMDTNGQNPNIYISWQEVPNNEYFAF